MELKVHLQETLGSAYTLERELGGGGMSRVFLATEQALGRPVVVKVLPSETAGALSMERFRREIRLAASLQQANIVPVLSAGDAGGVAYYTMPFVKGESLRSHLAAKGALPIAECVAILRDLARALAYAHGEGVVHRDIKPENILLSGGTAVVTDFGIAKAVAASSTLPGAATLTQLGVTLGTPAYMAPEQAVGEAVDHRADLYALGVVAYEMLTGAAPFAGRSVQAMLAAHVMEAPAALADKRADVPPGLAAIITRCLAKEQADRPESASAVLTALDTASTPQAIVAEKPAAEEKPSIAVLPFENLSPDPADEYFADGLTDEIITDLSPIHALRVVARASMMRFKGSGKDPQAVAREVHVRYVLDGSVRRAGNSLRLTARLTDMRDATVIWSDKMNGSPEDVFAFQEQVSRKIVEALRVALTPREERQLRERPIVDLQAYESYLQARQSMWTFTFPALDHAQRLIESATARIGENARLIATLGGIHINYTETGQVDAVPHLKAAQQCAERLASLDPDSFSLHFLRGWLQWRRGEIREAIASMTRARELDPNNADVGIILAYAYLLAGQDARARETADAYAALDPMTPLFQCMPGFCEILAGRPANAVEYYRKFWRLDVDNPVAHLFFVWSLCQAGEWDEARSIAETLADRFAATPFGAIGSAYAAALRKEPALGRRALTPEIIALSRHSEAMGSNLANALTLLGDHDAAIGVLENSVRLGLSHYPYLAREATVYAPLRTSPRFKRLLDVVRERWERGGASAEDHATDPFTAWAVAAPTEETPSIAVLPFANLSPDPADGYFADGLTDEIITDLSAIQSLRVIARASVTRYKHGENAPQIAARELGVRYVLDGSVRRAGPSFRLTLRLIVASNGATVWSDKLGGTIEDVFVVQERLSQAIVNALMLRLSPEREADRARTAQRRSSAEAVEAYLKGRHFFRLATAESLAKALETLRHAVELDPDFAPAHAALAYTYVWLTLRWQSLAPREAMPNASAAARRALELDPRLPEAYVALGLVATYDGWDPHGADRAFSEALRLNPNYAEAHWANVAPLVLLETRFDEAIAHARRAIELSPVDPWAHFYLAYAHYFARDFDAAIDAATRLVELHPYWGQGHFLLGFIQSTAGRIADATASHLRAIELDGRGVHHVAWLGASYALSGDIEGAERCLAEVDEHARLGAAVRTWRLPILAALGRAEDFMRSLEQAYEEHASSIVFVFTHPAADFVRRDARFLALLRRIGLEHLVSYRPKREWWGRGQAHAATPATTSEKPTIAVLPLTNMSANADDEYFSDGITEDIIAQLAQIASIRVISRTSVMRYKRTDKPMTTIADELNATHVIEGSVRRSGQQLRIVAKLVDARSDEQLWARTFDRQLTDVFAIQGEVAEATAQALTAALTPAERQRLERRPTENMDAYNAYLLGRFALNKRSPDELQKALTLFERAIQLDPNYAAPHAGLADAHVLAAIGYGAATVEEMPRAKAAAQRAILLDDHFAGAHTALGYIRLNFDWDAEGAQREFRRALELNPNSAHAHQWLAHALIYLERYADAAVEAEQAIELDPMSVVLATERAWYPRFAGDYEQAMRFTERALAMDESFVLARFNRAEEYRLLGRRDDALREYEAIQRQGPDLPFVSAYLAGLHVECGNVPAARAILSSLIERAERGDAVNAFVGVVLASLGEADEALAWLERAFRGREPTLAFLHLPTWISRTPAIDGFLERVGMVEQVRRARAGGLP